jgi:2-oxoglutarate ferredoxin oxidoreductase subunit gamma
MVAADKVPAGRTVVAVPATEIASGLGDVRVANMVMLGAYNAVKELLSSEALRAAVENATGAKGRAMLDTNFAAVERGAACLRGV